MHFVTDRNDMQLSTDAVKAMLSDDMKHMENVLDTVYELEMYFTREREEDALRFVLTIRDMLDHRVISISLLLSHVLCTIYMLDHRIIFM